MLGDSVRAASVFEFRPRGWALMYGPPTPSQALLGSWGPRENVPFLSPRQHGRTVLVNPVQEEEPGSSRPSCLAPWGPGVTAARQKPPHPLPGGPADNREFQPSRCLEGL